MNATIDVESILNERFPSFREDELKAEFIEKASIMEIPAGQVILDIGSFINVIPILISGTIKVIREDEEGKELLLYYITEKETCAMTLSCSMKGEVSRIRAVTEDDIVLMAVPFELMDAWTWKYQSWKNYVMDTFQSRFDELLKTIDNVAFKKMDERLFQYLVAKSEALSKKTISATHQEIAYDLNTSREVVSRLLKQLEKLERVKLSRNEVEIIGE